MLFTKDQDFLTSERLVEETLRTRRMRLCAYCLMPNHWHFVVWPERDGDLPAFMQQVTNTHGHGAPGTPYLNYCRKLCTVSPEPSYCCELCMVSPGTRAWCPRNPGSSGTASRSAR
ncbi:MAG: transposase [Planctomycetaceae bacterium]|nr:transposase [Planctomycetaceae bacterium]